MAIIGNAYIAVHAITTGFKDDVNKSLSGLNSQFSQAGSQSGGAFSNGLRRGVNSLSAFEQKAKRANDVFFRMVTTGYAIGPAIASAVGAISSLVSGFVALSASVLSATPALIALPSILTAIGQAALVAKLAFGGIGAALKEMTKTGGGGGGNDEAAEEARKKRIENAEKNLARVLESNRESLARASRNLADAEERLTDARKEAAESLQQLNFDAEDAAISEKKAALQLERARETLARVQDLPPNSRARREAELAYAEADLNLRRAKDRNQDLAKATEEANKKGVEGSEEVVNATRDLQDARDDLARTERDALRSQVDAEQELADAKKETAKAGGGGAGTAAFDKLSEAAKKFVQFLISIRPKLDELKFAAQEALLPPLQIAIQNLVDNLFPRLIPIIKETGAALGSAAIDFSNFVTEARNLDKLDAVAKTNVDTIGKLGIVFGNLYDSFLSLLAAADPLIRRFTDWIVTVTTGWQETLNAKLATGELTDTFNKAGDVAAQLGEIFGNIRGALMNIGEAAAGPGSGGQKLLDLFTDSTARFEEFTQKLLDNGRLEQFFNDVADNVNSISKLVVDLVGAFLRLGDDPAIGKTAEAFRPLVDNVGKIFEILQGGGPALAEFLDKLSSLLLKFTETGSINAFFETINKGLDILNAVFGNETVQKILLVIAPIMGIVKGLTLMTKVGGFVVKVFAGYFYKLKGLITPVIGLFSGQGGLYGALLRLGGLFGGGAGLGAGILGGIAAIVAALVLMWQNSEKFREAVKKLGEILIDKLMSAFERIKGALDTVLSKFGGTKGAVEGLKSVFEKLGDFFAKYIIPIVEIVLVRAIDYATTAINVFIYAVGAIIKVFQGVWEFVQGIFALFRGDMDGVKEHFGAAFNAIKDAFELVFRAIGEVFKYVWDGIKLAFDIVWEAIKAAIKFVWEYVIKPIFEAFLTTWQTAWNVISTVFTTAWDAIKAAIQFVWEYVIKPVFNAFGTVFSTVWNGIKTTFTTIWDGITAAVEVAKGVFEKAFNFIGDLVDRVIGGISTTISGVIGVVRGVANAIAGAFKGAWNFVADVWNNTIGKLSFTVPSWVPIFGGNKFSMPKLGKFTNSYVDPTAGSAYSEYYQSRVAAAGLAEGGIVPATRGGMLAVIGEAGRAERVEPLDPDGLSRRDREMIKMLAGPTGGRDVVVNVYPSKGMDEAELASMVSRQIAFQLRRGAA